MGRLIGTSTQYAWMSGLNFQNAYTYDAASNRASLTGPDGSTTTYGYDTLNRMNGLANSWAGSFGFGYDALSRRTSLTRPNGVNTSYAYDGLSHLLSVLHQAGNTVLDGASYTYDPAGNRLSKTNYLNGVTSNYGYDLLHELTQVTQGASTTESYTYDAVGNRLSSSGVPNYSYNSSNELTSNSNGSYTYDAAGNTLTDASGRSYTWDFENRLVQAVVPGSNGGTTTFKYDPFGRRIQKSGPLGVTNYLYDGFNDVEEVDGSGNLLGRYTQGSEFDEELSELRSGAASYYQADALGTITSLSSSAGALTNTYVYDSFGKPVTTTGTLTNPFQYTGRELDPETGIYFYRARYYDQNAGRFLREDPLRGISGSMNFYAYVANSPLNLFDPSGLCPSPDPCPRNFRLVPISDCSHRGYREIYYILVGFGASSWYITESQNPPGWSGSLGPGTQMGGYDDTIYGLGIGDSTQNFNMSQQDPHKFPNTPTCPVIIQLPSGPGGSGQDYGTIGMHHGGSKGYNYINGNWSGWVPCDPNYDEK